MTIPRPVAIALAGLALTATIAGCGSPHPSQQSMEKAYQEHQLAEFERQHIQIQIESREADMRRIAREELARQRRP